MSASQSPAEQPAVPAANPVSYPGVAAQASHRFSSRFVDLIVMVAVVAAAAVTAVVVFGSDEKARPAPPRDPGLNSGIFQMGDSPGPGRSVGFRRAPAQTAEALDIAGVPLVPAPGWKIADQGPGTVILRDKKDRVLLTLISAPAAEQNEATRNASMRELLAGVAKDTTKNMQDVELFPYEPAELESERFQEGQLTDYTSLLQTQDGTSQLWGTIGVLRNTSTGDVAVLHYFSGSLEYYKAGVEDFKYMLGSVLAS